MIERPEVEGRRSPGSFRDPSGYVFERDGILYRRVNRSYRDDYDRLMGSGLYRALVDEGLLVPHEEVGLAEAGVEADGDAGDLGGAYKVLRPERIPFISYPYEWSFSQLRDAAALTLEVQRKALEFDMALKDASAYNIQFRGGRPIFVDTLSFESYREGEPWVAYRQFCQHFLAPLALMSLADPRLGQLARTHIDGVPLDLASALLPRRSWLRPSLMLHLHLHARMQRAWADRPSKAPRGGAKGFSRRSLTGLIDHLASAVRGLRGRPSGVGWARYYTTSTYSEEDLARKERVVADYLDRAGPSTVWDLGANTGRFSRVASARGIPTISFDVDPDCVEQSYKECRSRGEEHILPLWLDLTNPSPPTGWLCGERSSIFDRGPADLVLALALIHHLVFSGNVPLEGVAEFFARVGRWLVVEFVPEDDPQAARLVAGRRGGLHEYSRGAFEAAFRKSFAIEASEVIAEGGRTLYLMRRGDVG